AELDRALSAGANIVRGKPRDIRTLVVDAARLLAHSRELHERSLRVIDRAAAQHARSARLQEQSRDQRLLSRAYRRFGKTAGAFSSTTRTRPSFASAVC